ncbi:MAG: type III toxin-antitoxin system ToxN/AbiQ family toxin [Oscillospiraceae bacterium]|nr:type III toxin-antitoxin system ToxN/AbiQ family toxin [Oscillospiraceae bacterium]
MNQKRLNIYTVNMKYIRNLHNADDKVFSVSPQTGKSNRPFIGIILICEDKYYCVPLSSPKEKHKRMKNDVDFMKITDSDGKLIGVLDFNNMIPVREDLVKKIDIKIRASDSYETIRYKNLIIDQLNFCRKNQDMIISRANKLYRIINKKNVSVSLKKRCLKFKKLEGVLEKFIL